MRRIWIQYTSMVKLHNKVLRKILSQISYVFTSQKKKKALILEKNPIVSPYFKDMQTTLLTNCKKRTNLGYVFFIKLPYHSIDLHIATAMWWADMIHFCIHQVHIFIFTVPESSQPLFLNDCKPTHLNKPLTQK